MIYKQIYEIDIDTGYLKNIHVGKFDEAGNPLDEIPEGFITVNLPQGLYKAKWDGVAWEEGMTYEEIEAFLNPPLDSLQEIDLLKAEISTTDWKIVKCMEYQLLGLPLPYDIHALYNERQGRRDRINSLEVAPKGNIK